MMTQYLNSALLCFTQFDLGMEHDSLFFSFWGVGDGSDLLAVTLWHCFCFTVALLHCCTVTLLHVYCSV